jgi:hypothetical protein
MISIRALLRDGSPSRSSAFNASEELGNGTEEWPEWYHRVPIAAEKKLATQFAAPVLCDIFPVLVDAPMNGVNVVANFMIEHGSQRYILYQADFQHELRKGPQGIVHKDPNHGRP